jgi:pyruvate dehydrogenase E2 component (dihydrolipoamide acetyltransferase)
MAISVVMPALEMAQETGKLIAWRKKEGESVAKGETLLEIETDKAVMEIESPGDGVLAGVKVQEGAVVPVGQTIAWIVRPGENPPSEVASLTQSGRASTEPRRPAVTAPESDQQSELGPRISPKARHLAREHGIEIGSLRGSGPDGAVLAEDIIALVQSGDTPVAKVETLGSVGRLMAERTTQGWTTVPHFFVTREVDASSLVQAREKLLADIEQSHGVRVTHSDLLVALVARALVKHPRINASWAGSGVRLNSEVNVSIAMAVDDGVVGAVIHHADRTSVGEIAKQRRELTERARVGRLRPADINGGTFTISNLGMYNVDAFSAIITPPQAAILAVGRIADRVVAMDGKPAVRPVVTMILSCDHRVADGARAAEFLNDLSQLIQNPQEYLR